MDCHVATLLAMTNEKEAIMTPPANSAVLKNDAPIEVSTGALTGSRKMQVAGSDRLMGVTVAQREVVLSEKSGEQPLAIYDTSGPYTDKNHTVDISAGLPKLRGEWIASRGDVEHYIGRPMRPEDNGYKEYQKIEVAQFPHAIKSPLRAKAGMNVTQMHYAKQGIITPEMEYIAIREN